MSGLDATGQDTVESAEGELTDEELDGVSGGLLVYEAPRPVPSGTTPLCYEDGISTTNCMFS